MATSNLVEQFVRSRLVRVSLAVMLLALSAWAFLPHLTSRVASSAFVNAELVRVAAPIAGRLAGDLPRKGDFIDHTRTVDLVQTLAPDQRHLLDMRRQQAVARERAELARKQIEEIDRADRDLLARTEAFRAGVVKRISREVEETNAEKKGCEAEAHQRRDVGSRMEQLAKSGALSQIRSAEALALQEGIQTRCEMAEARAQRLAVELESARGGVYLRDGANDVPYSQQQRDRLFIRRQELEAELLHESTKSVQLAAAITDESERLNRVGKYDVSLPADHVIWSMAASPGSTVVEGQSVLDLADCRHRFLMVELPEREFERIKAGDRADIRLVGSDDWSRGQVRQVRGSAARGDDRLLAAQVLKQAAGSITVEIALPEDAVPPDHNSFCGIGRLAEVRFPRPALALPAIVSRAIDWVTGAPDHTVAVANAKDH